jgi:hypothetical protein
MYDVDENDRVVALEGIPQSSVGAPEPVTFAGSFHRKTKGMFHPYRLAYSIIRAAYLSFKHANNQIPRQRL